MKQILATILGWFGGEVIQKIKACIPALVAAAEKAMEDGKITATERKAFVMEAIDIIAEKFGVKLNWIMKWVISQVVDKIAKALPSKDISVPDVIKATIKEWAI